MASKETKEMKDTKTKKIKPKKDKKSTVKKRETVVFANSDTEVINIINDLAYEDEVKEDKKEKKSNFFSELKAFFCILLIIGFVVLSGFLIHKYVKPLESKKDKETEETKIVESNEYKTVSYTAPKDRTLQVLNHMYVIESKDRTLYKVMDMDGNILFEGKEEYSSINVGIDGELYLSFYESTDEDNVPIGLYKIVDKKLEEVFVSTDKDYTYTTLLKINGDSPLLIGVVGEFYSFEDEENTKFLTKSVIYTLDGKQYSREDVRLTGDTVRLATDEPIYTHSDRYIIAIDSKDEYKYGVYDLQEDDMVINTKYDGLYTTGDGNYIAERNKKSGVIDVKSKILVDFKYEFISEHDDFYVVNKNNKLGILDNAFKTVIEPKFTYQENDEAGFSYTLCCGKTNSFEAYKVNDKYVLVVNNDELYLSNDYKIHETYVIDQDGEYVTIKANEFEIHNNFIYAYDKEEKKYTIYDNSFAEKYVIDISRYDFEEVPTIACINDSHIEVYLDSTLYFDFITGEELEAEKDAAFVVDKIEFKYSSKNNEVSLKVNGEVIATYDYSPSMYYNFYNNVKDELYYYVNDNLYVMVRKSN